MESTGFENFRFFKFNITTTYTSLIIIVVLSLISLTIYLILSVFFFSTSLVAVPSRVCASCVSTSCDVVEYSKRDTLGSVCRIKRYPKDMIIIQ